MRTRFRSCALVFTLVGSLAACAGNESRNGPARFHESVMLSQPTEFASPAEAAELAEALKNAGAVSQAFAVLAEAHERFPGDKAVLSAYGRQALVLGKDTLAERLLRRVLDADPDDWRALSAMAVLDARKGRDLDARAKLARAQTLSGGDAAVLNNLGMNYLLSGEPAQAASAFRKALAKGEHDTQRAARLKRNLAVALAVMGEFEFADRLVSEPLPRHLQNADAKAIAAFMGLTADRMTDSSGWTARLADASPQPAEPSR